MLQQLGIDIVQKTHKIFKDKVDPKNNDLSPDEYRANLKNLDALNLNIGLTFLVEALGHVRKKLSDIGPKRPCPRNDLSLYKFETVKMRPYDDTGVEYYDEKGTF